MPRRAVAEAAGLVGQEAEGMGKRQAGAFAVILQGRPGEAG